MGYKNLGIFILIATAIVLAQADDVVAQQNKHFVLTGTGPCADGTKYVVGDDKGWQVGVDYDAWIQGKDFRVGDIMVFELKSKSYNILVVNEDGVKTCCAASRVVEIWDLGRHEIVLTAPGRFGFMSKVTDECWKGMKFVITVKDK